LAEEKLAGTENADEFVGIAEADSFKIYVAAGKPSGRFMKTCMITR